MKTSRLLAASAAAATLTLAPVAAFAAPGPDGAGYNGGATEQIIVEDSTPETCTFPVTVEAGDAVTVTLTVRDSASNVAYEQTQQNDLQGTVTFTVDLGADCDGTYTLTATDEADFVLAISTVTVGAAGGGTNGGGTDAGGDVAAGGDNVGGLPSTGSSTAMLVGGVAGAGLLVGGSVLLVRRRRTAA